jgi:hypothetical protein
MIATIAAEELDTARSTPKVRRPPSLFPEISSICSVISCSASGGIKPFIVRSRSSIRVASGK